MAMAANQQILQQGRIGEQLNILKRPGYAETSD